MLDVEEICRKLKPILGAKAERYWLAYLAEDSRGKAELEIVLNLLSARYLSKDLDDRRVHLSVPGAEVAWGGYVLGNVVYCDRELHPFGLQESEWIQHVAVFGRSGAGKTNTVFIIIENFLDKKKPFLVFDWKRNYRDLLAVRDDEILVYTVGRNSVPFSFNPLIPPEGTDAATWLKKLIEIISHAYYLGEGVMYLLQEAIHGVYEELGVYSLKPKRYPTFEDVLQWLEDHPARGRKALWMDSALRGLKSICFGHMGQVVNTAVQPNIAALLEKNVIMELDSLTNADKTLIIESLLLWIHHYRLCQPERETFKHVLIIEEAHHILLKRTGAGQGGEAVTDTILREIRELGEGIVLVDQHPSLISVPAMGNTYATIALNVKHASDVNALGGAMLLSEEERDLIGRLPIGQAVVKLQGRWLEPFLIKIPHRKISKGAVDDAFLIQKMTQWNALKPYEGYETKNDAQIAGQSIAEENDPADCAKRNPEPDQDSAVPVDASLFSDRERSFLVDVMEHPLCGAVERYRNLHLSRRRGNDIRESLAAKGLLVTVDISLRSGKTVLVELTDLGRSALRDLGRSVSGRVRWGGLEHEYWKAKIAERFRRDGWLVELEEGDNGFTDIAARKDDRKVAIEIETGKSDWQANVEKNLKKGFLEIVIVATNSEALSKINKEFQELQVDAEVWIETAQILAE